MAAYSTLTTGQKAQVQHAANQMIRPTLGEFARVLAHLQATLDEYNGNGLGAVLSGIDTTEVVPNDSALAGAGDLTVANLTGMVTAIQAFLTSNNTAALRQTYAHWAGGPNVLG